MSDPTEAIREMFLGYHEFVDSTRLAAQDVLRHLVGNRIYVGRQPQGEGGEYILIQLAEDIPDYDISQEANPAQALVSISYHSLDRRKMWRMKDNGRVCITSFTGQVNTQDGIICIGGCTQESGTESPSDQPEPGTDAFEYVYEQTWKVTYEHTVPTGVN